mmetsp:Transcript_1167/g.4449  ORF Transcript_1167/g.4449 Transcript_1167/m.4449 type:complete len:302 (+) Transcript_1167:2075-2980(+)
MRICRSTRLIPSRSLTNPLCVINTLYNRGPASTPARRISRVNNSACSALLHTRCAATAAVYAAPSGVRFLLDLESRSSTSHTSIAVTVLALRVNTEADEATDTEETSSPEESDVFVSYVAEASDPRTSDDPTAPFRRRRLRASALPSALIKSVYVLSVGSWVRVWGSDFPPAPIALALYSQNAASAPDSRARPASAAWRTTHSSASGFSGTFTAMASLKSEEACTTIPAPHSASSTRNGKSGSLPNAPLKPPGAALAAPSARKIVDASLRRVGKELTVAFPTSVSLCEARSLGTRSRGSDS